MEPLQPTDCLRARRVGVSRASRKLPTANRTSQRQAALVKAGNAAVSAPLRCPRPPVQDAPSPLATKSKPAAHACA
jgi:hypothetical protein